MDNKRALITLPKVWTAIAVVGEHFNRRGRCTVRYVGAIENEDVGISNDNADEKFAHRNPQVS